ncbi:putative fibrinogen C domain-containing protein 1 [Apostichopus japonicus]|uniref:Putative fibrinogen C domain-containing protein 1 n=1 Tax=Stichopus japonicus TaxID=307972 RepID=A0A2G8JSA6_STIJA|nr:putative fibrinogen C domain-containing protein 1 [Apostichopus japonicus]
MIEAVETIETDAAGSTIVSYKSTTTIPTAHKVDPTLAQSSTAVGVKKTTNYGVTKHENKSSPDDKYAITVSSQLTSFSDDTAVSSTEFPPTIIRTTDTPTNYVEQTTSTGPATATTFHWSSSITPSLPPSSLASSVEVKVDDPNRSTSPGTQRGLTGSPDETSSGPSTQSNVDAETETNDVNTEPSSTSLMKSTSRPTVKEEQSDSTAATPTVTTTEATQPPPVTSSIDIVITPSIVDVPTIQPAAASSLSVTTSKRSSTDDDEFSSGEGPIFTTVPTHRDVTTPRLETTVTAAASSTKPTYSVFNVTGEKTVVEGHWTAHYDDNSTSGTYVTSGDITSKTHHHHHHHHHHHMTRSTATIEQEETSPTTKFLSSTPSDVMTTLSSSVSRSEKYEQDLSTRKATTEEDFGIYYADTTVDDVTSEVTATSPPKVTTDNDVTTHAITTPVDVTTKEAGTTVPPPPKDCYEIWQRGVRQNGVYVIHPPAFPKGFGVFCDLHGQTGGWTVIQRRVNGSVNFYRPYFDYVLGFGNLLKEFYLGNEFIHALTNQHNYELLIILFDGEGNSRFANYRPFRLGDYSSDYQLFVRGYSGNAGNSLGYHSKSKFSTFDRDNDNNPAENCARTFGSGWWFADCDLKSNLNGKYLRGGAHNQRGKGITWKKWKGLDYSLKFAEMKIKPYGLL